MEQTLAKFNGDNFFTWQSKTMYLLMRKGLWHLITGESTTSEIDAHANHKALGLIAQFLGDDVISHITGIMNAKAAWDELNKIFGTQSKSSKINLLMQFFKLNKEDNETMVVHINKFKAIKQQLLAVKKETPDDEAIGVLLNSVDKEPYTALVSTLQNVDKALQEVESALIEFVMSPLPGLVYIQAYHVHIC